MPQLSFITSDVFTTTRYAGNPLAIVRIPKGEDVATETMQEIAKEFNLSETVVLHEQETTADGIPEWRIRIFMTSAELPFAGHPTIGTACYAMGTLAKGSSKGRLLCAAGTIEIDFQGGAAKASIPHNVHIHTQRPVVAESICAYQPALRPTVLKAIDLASPVKGMNFVYVELESLEALASVSISSGKLALKLDDDWDVGFVGSYFYAFTGGSSNGEGIVKVRSRMIEGPLEDSATGSAACGLGALLALKQGRKSTTFEITQGVEMGRKSDIGVTVQLDDNLKQVKKVELSGSAVKVMEGTLDYD